MKHFLYWASRIALYLLSLLFIFNQFEESFSYSVQQLLGSVVVWSFLLLPIVIAVVLITGFWKNILAVPLYLLLALFALSSSLPIWATVAGLFGNGCTGDACMGYVVATSVIFGSLLLFANTIMPYILIILLLVMTAVEFKKPAVI